MSVHLPSRAASCPTARVKGSTRYSRVSSSEGTKAPVPCSVFPLGCDAVLPARLLTRLPVSAIRAPRSTLVLLLPWLYRLSCGKPIPPPPDPDPDPECECPGDGICVITTGEPNELDKLGGGTLG